ncbi:MAG: ABC transporter transmembrane domain-containing protein, partial [Clostridia bacterium]
MKKFRTLFSFISSFKVRYIFAIILALLSSACVVLCPLILGKAINLMIFQNTDFKLLAIYVIVLIALYTLSEVLNYYVNLQAGVISFRIMKNIRSNMFEKIQTMPISEIDKIPFGDFVSRITMDVENIGNGLSQGAIQLLRGVGLIVGTMIAMLSLNLTIGL